MEIQNQQGTQIKKTTKVFKGIRSKDLAEDYAKEVRSYIFRLFIVENIYGVIKKTFYGFGVPR